MKTSPAMAREVFIIFECASHFAGTRNVWSGNLNIPRIHLVDHKAVAFWLLGGCSVVAFFLLLCGFI